MTRVHQRILAAPRRTRVTRCVFRSVKCYDSRHSSSSSADIHMRWPRQFLRALLGFFAYWLFTFTSRFKTVIRSTAWSRRDIQHAGEEEETRDSSDWSQSVRVKNPRPASEAWWDHNRLHIRTKMSNIPCYIKYACFL